MMVQEKTPPTGKEIFFPENELIVSKTDLKGKIAYTNLLFEKTSGYSRDELLGQPHNIIRHPHMPRCIFDLLWSNIQQQKEIFAYIFNMHKNGDHYWVLAHVVPSFDIMGKHIGYHSSRRCPKKDIVQQMAGLYKKLFEIEKNHQNPAQGMMESHKYLQDFLDQKNTNYAEHILSLSKAA